MIEYKIVLTRTNIQIDADGNRLARLAAPPISATVTVAKNENGEALPLHDILDKLFNQIYGKMTEVDT